MRFATHSGGRSLCGVALRAPAAAERIRGSRNLLARKPFKVVAVALANKMARMAWALLAKGSAYRAPMLVAAWA